MKIKVNLIIPGFQIGQIVDVETDKEGTPKEFFWRRKLKEAKLNNCCNIVKEITNTIKSVEVEKNDTNTTT